MNMKPVKYPNQGDSLAQRVLNALTMVLSGIGFTAAIVSLLVFL